MQDPASRRSRPRILEAARRLASAEGEGPLTMEAIAASSGVTRRTLYNHFANLGDLCMVACAPLFAHCRAALPLSDTAPRPVRDLLHALACDVVQLQRDPVHIALKRTAKLQSLTAPQLRHAYSVQIREPLRRIVAGRLSASLPGLPSETLADEVLSTLEAANRLDYLVRDLERAGAGAVIVDMLLDRLDLQADQPRRAA
ncbi:hypothetical protein NOVOSPHI9U_60254 [Novosphingobium sp. 9U]|nr:hypothetical protein NOVOSPHI9U_60254 [Novosphingobium sp. 9U]